MRLARCAADAACGSRIKFEPWHRDIVAAGLAIAVFAFIQCGQSALKPGTFSGATGLLGLGHGLVLQRVHPAETAYRLLVQCDHRLTFRAQGIVLGDLGQSRLDQGAHFGFGGFIHVADGLNHRFAFGLFSPKWVT